MPQTYKLEVAFIREVPRAPTAPSIDSELISNDVFVSKLESAGKFLLVGAGATLTKRVIDYRIDTTGIRTGNFDRENRIKSQINTFKGLVNPVQTAEAIYKFNLTNENSAINAEYAKFTNGPLIDGGR